MILDIQKRDIRHTIKTHIAAPNQPPIEVSCMLATSQALPQKRTYEIPSDHQGHDQAPDRSCISKDDESMIDAAALMLRNQ